MFWNNRCDARLCFGQASCLKAAEWLVQYTPQIECDFPCEFVEADEAAANIEAFGAST